MFFTFRNETKVIVFHCKQFKTDRGIGWYCYREIFISNRKWRVNVSIINSESISKKSNHPPCFVPPTKVLPTPPLKLYHSLLLPYLYFTKFPKELSWSSKCRVGFIHLQRKMSVRRHTHTAMDRYAEDWTDEPKWVARTMGLSSLECHRASVTKFNKQCAIKTWNNESEGRVDVWRTLHEPARVTFTTR